jgi:hypothetical protein
MGNRSKRGPLRQKEQNKQRFPLRLLGVEEHVEAGVPGIWEEAVGETGMEYCSEYFFVH